MHSCKIWNIRGKVTTTQKYLGVVSVSGNHCGNCMKYLNTLNKVQIDQKSAVGLPTVPAYCLTITLNFLLC